MSQTNLYLKKRPVEAKYERDVPPKSNLGIAYESPVDNRKKNSEHYSSKFAPGSPEPVLILSDRAKKIAFDVFFNKLAEYKAHPKEFELREIYLSEINLSKSGEFLQLLKDKGILPDWMSATHDGSIVFEFCGGQQKAVVEIDNDGGLGLALSMKFGDVKGIDMSSFEDFFSNASSIITEISQF